jgi:ferredoxin
MGHVVGKSAYLDLQRRLDRMPIGSPFHRAFVDLLAELYTDEECRVAAAIPLRPATLDRVATAAGVSEDHARRVLDGLADKGLVVDLPRDDRPTLYHLNPAIIGFFEFTMMRVREDVDQARVAGLMWEYVRDDPELGFLRMLASGDTFIARPLVDDTVLMPEDFTEILDWQRATAIIDDADAWAEGICHCRHVKLHLGERCDYPLEHCLSLGRGADYLVRHGMARSVTRERAHEILDHARDHGCVQMADNVKNRPSFICNCCACCCEMLEGFRTLPQMTSVISSGWMAVADDDVCTGCGTCVQACPIDAIEVVHAERTDAAPKRRKRARVEAMRCLGCGVCVRACRFDSMEMAPAEKRVHTPDDILEKTVRQAIEHGRLAELLLDDPSRLSHRALGAALRVVLALPPARQALANRQLRSRFVDAMLGGLRRTPEATAVTEGVTAPGARHDRP